MTNYEAIKEMSMEEMATMFYLFAKPILDAFDFDKDQQEKVREIMRKNTRAFLAAEVKRRK